MSGNFRGASTLYTIKLFLIKKKFFTQKFGFHTQKVGFSGIRFGFGYSGKLGFSGIGFGFGFTYPNPNPIPEKKWVQVYVKNIEYFKLIFINKLI